MRTRFEEISKELCQEWGLSIEDVKGKSRKDGLPILRAKIIHRYKTEYPYTTWKSIGRWLNMDHSSVITAFHNCDNGIYDNVISKPLDYSGFVSFGYKNKIRFKHNYV